MSRRHAFVVICLAIAACTRGATVAPSPSAVTPGSTPAPAAAPVAATEAAVTAPAAPPVTATSLPANASAADPALDLTQFAPPPLPVEQSRRIQRLIDVRGAGPGLLTSRGDRMVFSWSVTGVNQVWRMDGPQRFPVQLTGGEDRTTVEAISPDDRWLVVSRDAGGEETPGLFVVGIDGGPLQTIVHAPRVRARLAFISDDARWVYYTANDVQPQSQALYRWERATGRREQLLGEPGLWIPRDHRGDHILLARALGANHIEYHLFEIQARRLAPLFGQNEKVRYDAALGARPGTYLVKQAWLDADNGPRRLDVITDIEDCALFIKKEWAVAADLRRSRASAAAHRAGRQRPARPGQRGDRDARRPRAPRHPGRADRVHRRGPRREPAQQPGPGIRPPPDVLRQAPEVARARARYVRRQRAITARCRSGCAARLCRRGRRRSCCR
jgi:hypothetical protein